MKKIPSFLSRARPTRDFRSSGLAAAVLAVGLAGVLRPAGGTEPALQAPGKRVVVGTHALHLLCVGRGEPTVILDAGLGGNFLDWVKVQPALGRQTRTCSYDRAGNGWSDPGPRPRTSARIAAELRGLLDKAEVPGPYVLVGHSFAGYGAQLFATWYPGDMAGLVLIDAAHEDQHRRFRAGDIGVDTAPRGSFVLRSRPGVPDGLPERARPMARALVRTPKAYRAMHDELSAFRDSARQVRDAAPRFRVPLVVITRGRRLWPETGRGERMERLWSALQRDLASRSPDAVHLVAPRSGHHVHLDEPALVVRAILGLVDAYRGRRAAVHSAPRDTIPHMAGAWYRVTRGAGQGAPAHMLH